MSKGKVSVWLNLRAKHIEKGRSPKSMERSTTSVLVWCKSDDGQTVPLSNRESHSLKRAASIRISTHVEWNPWILFSGISRILFSCSSFWTSLASFANKLEEFDFCTRPYSNASVDRAGTLNPSSK